MKHDPNTDPEDLAREEREAKESKAQDRLDYEIKSNPYQVPFTGRSFDGPNMAFL